MSQMRKPTANHEGGSQKMSYERLTVEKPRKKRTYMHYSKGVTIEPLRLQFGNPMQPLMPKILELYRERLTDYRIAKTLGVARSTIKRWRDKRGLPPHGKKKGA
jgi:hypothetical protein